MKSDLLSEAISDAKMCRELAMVSAGLPAPLSHEDKVQLYVGKSLDAIRLWLCKVRDEDSLLSLYGAADSFINKYRGSIFTFNISGNADTIKNYEVRGKLINLEIPEPLGFADGYFTANVNFDLKDFDPIRAELIRDQIKYNGYFFLTGEIEGDVENGKEFVQVTKIFNDIERHIITDIKFISLQFHYKFAGFLSPNDEFQTLLPIKDEEVNEFDYDNDIPF